MVVLSKIRRADESLLVIASDDWAIHRVCKRFCKVSLDCHIMLAMTSCHPKNIVSLE